jgi:hypothetical protein
MPDVLPEVFGVFTQSLLESAAASTLCCILANLSFTDHPTILSSLELHYIN